ncbi:MAG: energy transducer TonB [Syntrophobacteraceae bacterium]
MRRKNALSPFFEEDTSLRTLRFDEDAELDTETDLFLRPFVLSGREAILGLGLSVGIHVAIVLLALLPFFSMPHAGEQPSCITASLVSLVGNGNGTGAVQNGAEGAKGFAGEFESGPAGTSRTFVDQPSDDAGKETVEIQHRPECSLLERPSLVRRRAAASKDKKAASTELDTTPESHSNAVSDIPDASSNSIATSYQVQPAPRGAGTTGECDRASGSERDGTSREWTGSGHSGGGGASSAGAGSAPGEFNLKQVDQPPSPIRKVEPEFPLLARQMGTGGRVVVKFLVKADGNVSRISVVEADPGGIFEQSALNAVCRWRFKPGRFRGDAVATWVVLPIQFRFLR